MQPMRPSHSIPTSPHFPGKRSLFRLWHRWERWIKRIIKRLQQWLGWRSSPEVSSAGIPELPDWRLSSDRLEPPPPPIQFLSGIEDFPEFSYWSTQDLCNSIWESYSNILPLPIVSSPVSSSSGFSFQELAKGFEDAANLEEPSPLHSTIVAAPPKQREICSGLQDIPQWMGLSAADLVAIVDWDRSILNQQTASEDDLQLLGDLLAELPD